MMAGRTAPSASGPPHAGTVFSALLALWQARQHGAKALARIEDLDAGRVRPPFVAALRTMLLTLGYADEDVSLQSDRAAAHAAVLDALCAAGNLYACTCERARLRSLGGYDNACRTRGRLQGHDWRQSPSPVRLRLAGGLTPAADVDHMSRRFDVQACGGDPIVRRKDGTLAYVSASVVDDLSAGITQVVRGRDLAFLTPQQISITSLLGGAVPSYRHHLLLLGSDGKKLSKSRGDGRPWARADIESVIASLGARLAQFGLGASDFAWHRLPPHDLPWPDGTAA